MPFLYVLYFLVETKPHHVRFCFNNLILLSNFLNKVKWFLIICIYRVLYCCCFNKSINCSSSLYYTHKISVLFLTLIINHIDKFPPCFFNQCGLVLFVDKGLLLVQQALKNSICPFNNISFFWFRHLLILDTNSLKTFHIPS